MSGAQTSTFADPNILYKSLSGLGATEVQHNQLLNTEAQQQVGATEMDTMGRAAAGLLSLPDENARAAAYPGVVQQLQANGFAKNAPTQYPGEGVLRSFAGQALPVEKQYELGILTPPGLAAALGGTRPAPGPGGAPAAPGGSPALTGDLETDRKIIAQRESGNNPTVLNYVAQADPTAYARGATASGKYQFVNSTWQEGMKLAGLDPAQYPTAMQAPEAVQDKVFTAVYGKYGTKPWDASTYKQNWVPAPGGRFVLANVTAPPTTAPAAPPGGVVARNPGSVQVAGPGALTPPAAPAATPPAPPAVVQNTVAPPVPPAQLPAAQPPAQPPPAQPGTAAAARANLPHYTDVPSGANSQARQQWQGMQDQINALIPYAALPQAKAKIAQLQSQQQVLMSTDSVVQTQEGPYHPLTGVLDDPRKVTPNYVYDPTQHAYIDTTGTNKPEFEPAQRDTAVAQRTVMELGPKVANGTATPQEKAQYDVAATTYQQPTLRENPVTKETVRVNTRELPAGFPPPSGSGGGGASGGTGSGSQVVMPGYSPAQQQIEQNPASYKVSESQYDRDSKEIAGISDAGRQAQADQIRINEMQDVLQRFSSGPGTEWRTAASAFLQRWLPASVTGWEKQSENLSGAEAAQVFAKLAVTGAGSQERSVLGNRGGFQAIKMFSAANPNVNLQDATNKSILDMQLISNQANQDYSQGAQSHFAANETSFGGPTHQYTSLAQFDTQWNAQRNPQVYAAAMGAISGQPPSQWTKGLSDDEYARALQIVQRAKPSAVVQTKNGPYSMQPNAVTNGAQPKSGDTIIRFDHNGNRIQ